MNTSAPAAPALACIEATEALGCHATAHAMRLFTISEVIAPLSPETLRECRLAAKRATTGLTDAERIELAQIIEEANRRDAQQYAADCAAERYSESRTFNRAGRVNHHD